MMRFIQKSVLLLFVISGSLNAMVYRTYFLGVNARGEETAYPFPLIADAKTVYGVETNFTFNEKYWLALQPLFNRPAICMNKEASSYGKPVEPVNLKLLENFILQQNDREVHGELASKNRTIEELNVRIEEFSKTNANLVKQLQGAQHNVKQVRPQIQDKSSPYFRYAALGTLAGIGLFGLGYWLGNRNSGSPIRLS